MLQMLGINARVSESDCIVWLSAASDDQGDILLARKISGNVFVFHVLYFLIIFFQLFWRVVKNNF